MRRRRLVTKLSLGRGADQFPDRFSVLSIASISIAALRDTLEVCPRNEMRYEPEKK